MSPSEDLGKGWYKCSSCGATWTDVIQVGASPISIESRGKKQGTKYKARAIHRRREKAA